MPMSAQPVTRSGRPGRSDDRARHFAHLDAHARPRDPTPHVDVRSFARPPGGASGSRSRAEERLSALQPLAPSFDFA